MNLRPHELTRFWSRVEKTHECWNWVGGKTPEGYGQMSVPSLRRPFMAHRIAYELLIGPIPMGLHLDHLCRNPGCVNPAHLEPVTCKENVLHGVGLTAKNARKTHCAKGHSLAEGLFYTRKDKTQRYCKICAGNAQRRYHGRPEL